MTRNVPRVVFLENRKEKRSRMRADASKFPGPIPLADFTPGGPYPLADLDCTRGFETPFIRQV